jgi:hypothetical protein
MIFVMISAHHRFGFQNVLRRNACRAVRSVGREVAEPR